MFTGIIEDLGDVVNIVKFDNYWDISISSNFNDVKLGESISVNGVCLTISSIDELRLDFQIISETLNVSSLDLLKVGDKVNLERSMMLHNRIDGHLVQGHVESIGEMISKTTLDGETKVKVKVDENIMKYCIYKGSITIDGISLTISNLGENFIDICVIPYTLDNTTLGYKEPGSFLNIETDMIAKYVEKQMDSRK